MSTYTQIIYQIVFSTKNRENILLKDNRSKLFEYIVRIFRNNKCHLYRINAVEDHVHIVSHLHPTVALASFVKDKDKLIEYVKNQEEHHRKVTFREEYIALLNEHGIEFDEKYLL